MVQAWHVIFLISGFFDSLFLADSHLNAGQSVLRAGLQDRDFFLRDSPTKCGTVGKYDINTIAFDWCRVSSVCNAIIIE